MRIVMTRGILLALVIVVALILLAEPLTQLFYRDPKDPVYQYTLMGFRLMPLCIPLAVLSLHYAAYCQVTEKKVMAVVLPVVDGLIGVAACSLVLIPRMQMNGLYLSNILNGVICSAVIVAGAWLSLKRCPRSMEDLLAIPDRIGVRPENRIDISVASAEEVTQVSQQITTFCQSQGIDARQTYFAALCMEEMAGNVVLHGFPLDKKQHSADIRVVHKEQEIILRIRDNCAAFNPSEYHKSMQTDEEGRNIGIKLVYSIAKEVTYQNLLGMNVLTIRI